LKKVWFNGIASRGVPRARSALGKKKFVSELDKCVIIEGPCQDPFSFDGINRLEKNVNGQSTRFAYDGQNVWADLNGNQSNQLQTRYFRGDMV